MKTNIYYSIYLRDNVIFGLGREKRARVLKKIGALQFLSTKNKVSKIKTKSLKKNNKTANLRLRHDDAFTKQKLKKKEITVAKRRKQQSRFL
jgi:hypothetical protein